MPGVQPLNKAHGAGVCDGNRRRACGGAVTVTVSANGGTIDNNGSASSPAIAVTITGEGGLTLAGSGVTRVFADQAYTGATTVSSGTTLSVPGDASVTFAGPLAFQTNATLSVASYSQGTVPVVAAGATFPESGTVNVALEGLALASGQEYPVIRLSGGAFAASDLDRIALPAGVPASAALDPTARLAGIWYNIVVGACRRRERKQGGNQLCTRQESPRWR